MYINKNESDKMPTVGLALGSGGARGLTHIGVLRAIEEKGIKIDYISGCSIGALVGGAYALGMSVDEIEEIALKTNWKQLVKLFSPSLSLSSLVNDNYLSEFLFTIFGDKTFNDLKIPFSAVASDIQNGESVVIQDSDILTAVRASISIPILFSPVTIANRKLVDGGLVNPVPVDVVKQNNLDRIIAVNLRRFGSFGINSENDKEIIKVQSNVKELSLNEKIQYFIKNPIAYISNSTSKKNPEPKIGNILNQMLIIVQVQIGDLSLKINKPDVLIEPDTGEFNLFDFNKAKQLIKIGYDTAKKQLEHFEL